MPLYDIPDHIQTRWASPENPDALVGEAAQANDGRKGMPWNKLSAGETLVLAHGEGSGTIRRIWITISEQNPEMLRGIVIRMYWDGESKPAVEAPIGDFFCMPLGRTVASENEWFSNPEGRSFNCRVPMPFRKGFRITATNESPADLAMFFYDVDFTIGDEHGPGVCYFHSHYRRENPTALLEDFTILPKVEGRGRFLGCSVGVIANTGQYKHTWWGEGEVKIYLDRDSRHPTLCGTGTEDYIGTGWGLGKYDNLYQGCPICDREQWQFSFYRLHGPDPVYFHKDIRVAIQQIGFGGKDHMLEHMRDAGIEKILLCRYGTKWTTVDELEQEEKLGLFERHDDWCATSYFYLNSPSNDLPAIQPYEERVAGLTGNPKAEV